MQKGLAIRLRKVLISFNLRRRLPIHLSSISDREDLYLLLYVINDIEFSADLFRCTV
jgi:hypothetical protein